MSILFRPHLGRLPVQSEYQIEQERNRRYTAVAQTAHERMARLRADLHHHGLPGQLRILDSYGTRSIVLQNDRSELLVTDPRDTNYGTGRHPAADGLARISCSFRHHTFYYIEYVVPSLEELYALLEFHLQLERHQHARHTSSLYVPRSVASHRFLPSHSNRMYSGWIMRLIEGPL